MQTSHQGEAFIAKFGYWPKAYKNSDGDWVVGYHHRAESWSGARVCRKDAQDLLRYDLMQIESQIGQHLDKILPPHRYDALVSLIHDVGIESVEKTGLFEQISADRISAAATCFDQIGRDNRRRRWAEKNLFLDKSAYQAEAEPGSNTQWIMAVSLSALLLMGVGVSGLVPYSASLGLHTNALSFLAGAWLYIFGVGYLAPSVLRNA